MNTKKSPLARILDLVKLEKSEISAIYFYAILNGLILLIIPLGVQSIVGIALGASFRASIYVLVTLVILSVLASGLMQINQMKLIEKIEQRIFVRYAFRYATVIPKIDLKKNDGVYFPELINRFFDTTTLQKSLAKILLETPSAFIQILFGLILLCFYHINFIIFSLLLILVLWAILYYTGGRGLATSLEESRNKYRVAAWLEEMARVIKYFKLASSHAFHLRKTDRETVSYLKARNEHFKILLLQYRSLVGFKTLITAAMLIYGSVLLINQQLTVGQFVAAEIIILTILNSVEKLIINLDSVYETLTAVDKLAKLTDKPQEESGDLLLSPKQEGLKVEAEKLTFSYDNGQPIVNNVSFMFNPGDTICIKGKAGTGKSTLLRILDGAYPDFDGALRVNQIPLRNYDLESLRSNIGILLHQHDIFQGTLWENITLGRDDIDMKRVIDIMEKISLSSFFASLPKGFDTELDPMGQKLPRQIINKLMLVRALANSPRLLLLEEPWSGMEDVSRMKIIRLLEEFKNTTKVIVSNDEEFEATCNQVIEFHEDGTATVSKNN